MRRRRSGLRSSSCSDIEDCAIPYLDCVTLYEGAFALIARTVSVGYRERHVITRRWIGKSKSHDLRKRYYICRSFVLTTVHNYRERSWSVLFVLMPTSHIVISRHLVSRFPTVGSVAR